MINFDIESEKKGSFSHDTFSTHVHIFQESSLEHYISDKKAKEKKKNTQVNTLNRSKSTYSIQYSHHCHQI